MPLGMQPLGTFSLVAGGAAAKTMERVGFGVNPAARRVILMERAADLLVPVRSEIVVLQDGCNRKVAFYVGDFHC